MGKSKKGKGARNVDVDSDGEADLDPIAKALKEINEGDTATKAGGKKGKKKKKNVDELFDELAVMDGENDEPEGVKEPEEEVSAAKGKKGKKGRRKKDDWDMDDIAQEIEALSMEKKPDKATQGNKTAQNAAAAPEESNEKEDTLEDEQATERSASIDYEDDGDDLDGSGPVMKTAAQKRAEKKERDKKKKELQKAEARNRRMKEKPKDGGSKEAATADDEQDVTSTADAAEVKDADDVEDAGEQKKSKRKKKKGKEDVDVIEVEGSSKVIEADDVEDSGEQKKSRRKKKKGKEEDVEVTEVEGSSKVTAPGEVDEKDAAEDGEEEEDEGDKKKKRKKKKKGKDEEEEKDKKKKPVNARVRAMQEALKKMKEEEERLKAEEEAKEKAALLAEEKRLEKLKLEKEKKDREKQKKKERIERLKKEGKYLNKSQKEAKARAEAMLASMKQLGIEVPSKEALSESNKGKVKYGVRERKKKDPTNGKKAEGVELQRVDSEEKSEELSSETQEGASAAATVEVEAETPKEEEIQESWEEVTDSWDAGGTEDEEEPSKEEKPSAESPPASTVSEKPKPQENVDDDEDDEDEDSEEASSSEEEEEDSESESESESESDEERTPAEKIREKVKLRIQKRREDAEAKKSIDKLRSPVVVVLGHVDTGKTKILDKIRHSHVQDGEAGGITQQIGATMVPPDAIKEQTKMCRLFAKEELKIPGLLIIDTPGHESFSNLRSRGSSLCDIAILVVDIMHGLEPQTIESLNLLRSRKTPFIVALNKIDVLYEWKTSPHTDITGTIKKQKRHTRDEFEERVKATVTAFAEQGLNAALFFENPDPKSYVSLVPTSAHSGDGMGNLIALLIEYSQTRLAKRLAFSDELQCTTLEVKSLPGLGTTVDVVLVNGRLREGDTIILAGQEGPIITPVRGLLMPQPLKELRVKNQYEKFKEITGAQGVKILAKDLEKALAGMPLLVAQHPDEVDFLKDEVSQLLKDALKSIKLADLGVYVQASTLGSLEALLEFLKTSEIPYAGISIGPVHKKDVVKASVMLERDGQYAVILAFDVKIERDAQDMADREGIKIFQADIIYHLFDRFMAYREEIKQKQREEHKNIAIFPCKLKVMPQFIFNARNPIVVGVMVEAGIVKVGTPICVPSKECIVLGAVSSIEVNHKNVETARKGQEVCIKIENTGGDAPKMYGRHFDSQDILISRISRESINAVKKYFRDDLQKSDWQTMIELKRMLEIL
ncbi:eukaryotic translation initiation factor 5B-like [Asterias amurensis]|uniref:eukaryotic translation initiation factor 5B-like n=1 Tax=Asterias amurensis TaxID=7602 RepID=UPI003AB50B6C